MIERRIKAATFPTTKSLDSLDFKAIPPIDKTPSRELARREFIDCRENVTALGPSGTGKTDAVLGLGLGAWQKGLKVRVVSVTRWFMGWSSRPTSAEEPAFSWCA